MVYDKLDLNLTVSVVREITLFQVQDNLDFSLILIVFFFQS